MLIGTTLAHPHLKYLKLDLKDSLNELRELNVKIVRLGVYWKEVQIDKDTYNYKNIKEILTFCESNDIDVILTIGMKAPRWPEFYIPKWLGKRPDSAEPYIYKFLEKSLNELKEFNCIKYFQIENEPLDPSGPDDLIVPLKILKKEVELVRTLDSKPIVLNIWGNQLSSRDLYPEIAKLADIIGIDLYYKTPYLNGYRGPEDSDENIRKILESLGKPIWFTELQAEPWEMDELVSNSFNPPSMNEKILNDNLIKAAKFDPDKILLWGFEYWLMRKSKGDSRLWDKVKSITSRV